MADLTVADGRVADPDLAVAVADGWVTDPDLAVVDGWVTELDLAVADLSVPDFADVDWSPDPTWVVADLDGSDVDLAVTLTLLSEEDFSP